MCKINLENVVVEDFSTKRINALAYKLQNNGISEEDFLELLKILSIRMRMDQKTNENKIQGNCKFMDEDDFMSEFYVMLIEAIQEYDFNIGDFLGYVSMKVKNRFAQCKKQSHLTVHCYKKGQPIKKTICIDAFEKELGYQNTLDKTILRKEIRECINALPEFHREIIETIFFSDPYKRVPLAKAAQMLNITENQLHYLLPIVLQKLYNMGICSVYDFNSEIADDDMVVSYMKISERKYSGLDTWLSDDSRWKSQYYYYNN